MSLKHMIFKIYILWEAYRVAILSSLFFFILLSPIEILTTMANNLSSKVLPHLAAVGIFILVSAVYFYPMFGGKNLMQSDIMHYKGMAKEITDHREKTGEDALWTNSMFSGMPAYLISMRQPGNLLVHIHGIINAQAFRPACHAFLYMIGFYILLLLFGVNPWLGITGALAYGFSSYLFIILAPGHITKAMALGYMPMIIGSVYYTFRRNFITGSALTALFLGLQLLSNHLQITYYTFLMLLLFGIFELSRVIREKAWTPFLKALSGLILAAILAVAVNITSLWTVYEYSPYTLRGPSELTHNSEDQTSGLNKSYATQWSYGIGESFNLLIPNSKGGASDILMADQDSKTFQYLSRTQGAQNAVQIINSNAYFFTQYWGDQPGTSGPVYIGAVVIFFFVFGMFFLKGNLKWWVFSAFVLSLLLSWGKNFMFLTDFFLDHFPGYNKFRTVSMILVIAELVLPLLAVLAISELVNGNYEKKHFIKSLKYSFYGLGGLSLLFVLAPSVAGLDSPKDALLIQQGAGDLVNAIKEDRAGLVRMDAIRTLMFILASSGLVLLFHLKKLGLNTFIAVISLLIVIDLWPINKRYVNNDNFVPERQLKTAFQPYPADLEILNDKDLSYRVFDLTDSDPFASSRASYFHKSVGGYHGAKFRRYQELYDNLIKEGKESALDMLNTRYLIINDKQSGQPVAVKRDNPLGNAWFVPSFRIVENADQEMAAMKEIEPALTAVVNKQFAEYLEGKSFRTDSLSTILLEVYEPNRLQYRYTASSEQLCVFSEIYYPKGWKLYVDDAEIPHFRANYVLRAALLPAGSHSLVFEFHPKAYHAGNKIALASSLLLFLVLGGIAIRGVLQKRKAE
jgi:hypothetical protein